MNTKTPIRIFLLAAAVALVAAPGAATAQTLYVSSLNGNTITKIDSSGTTSPFATLPESTGFYSGALVFDSTGNLFVSDYHEISKITPAGVVSRFAALAGNAVAGGLAFDGSGNLFAQVGNQIEKFATSGVMTPFATLPSNVGGGSLLADHNGTLYVPDGFRNQIDQIDSGGNVSVFASINQSVFPGGGPYDLAFGNSDQTSLLASDQNRQVSVVNSFGSGPAEILPDGSHALGIAKDSAGNLYVADAGQNQILKYAANGSTSSFALDSPNFIAVAPSSISTVPETSTWLMGTLLATIGLVDFARRHRRRA